MPMSSATDVPSLRFKHLRVGEVFRFIDRPEEGPYRKHSKLRYEFLTGPYTGLTCIIGMTDALVMRESERVR